MPCPENQTSLIFHIESAPCLQASCGANGACYQYFSGGYVFSTCVCWAGKHGKTAPSHLISPLSACTAGPPARAGL